jgi:RNA polymerase sigma factor (sigma-70 family)
MSDRDESLTATEDLLEPAVVGDHTALGRLIVRTSRYVEAALYHRFGHRLLERIGLSDVVNETHVTVLEKFATFQGGTNKKQFRSWMVTIAFRIVLDWIRKPGGGGRRAGEPVDVDDITPQGGKTPSSLVRQVETYGLIEKAVAELPEEDQALIRMRIERGCSHEEIAQALSIQPATSRKRFERILRRLRQDLE